MPEKQAPPEKITEPYGSWPSPLPAAQLAAGAISRSEPRVVGSLVVWAERRPADQGRTTLVCADLTDPHAQPRDVTDMKQADVNTRVHEYGGGAWLPLPEVSLAKQNQSGSDLSVLGVNALDQQRIWLFDRSGGRAISPAPDPDAKTQWRYADPALVPNTSTTVWVRETHQAGGEQGGNNGGQPANEIVSVALDGTVVVLAQGADFYASPQPSPDGTRLAFISWDHPNMPWDSTRLHVIDLPAHKPAAEQGRAAMDRDATAGVVMDGLALQQPRWSPDGQLHVVSETADGHGDSFWDIVRVDHQVKPNHTPAGLVGRQDWTSQIEFGVPSWTFANQTYAWAPDPDADRLWCTWVDRGIGHIGIISTAANNTNNTANTPAPAQLTEVHSGFTEFGRLETTPAGTAVTVASSWTTPAAVVEISPDGTHRQLSEPTNAPLKQHSVSQPQIIEFPTQDRLTAHGFYFPPTSATHQGPADELPPLLVLGHGGPTGRARSCLDLGIQYWTSRGIGVVDVNYRGSTGYGTAYRNSLRGLWGVADMEDCVAAARYLSEGSEAAASEAAAGKADPQRLVIKGGSAGGYTTLCALVETDIFAAGLTRYGVADLESLVRDTHKFESRYLDSLVGPWPEATDLYRKRSPLYRSELLRTPMLVLQGDQDLVVPPSQSEQLIASLAQAGVPHCYLLFEGEAHGFRSEHNIVAAAEAELSFLSQVLDFPIADQISPVPIAGQISGQVPKQPQADR